jgi:16S rRNA (cytosine967-C5)-methyltransferase
MKKDKKMIKNSSRKKPQQMEVKAPNEIDLTLKLLNRFQQNGQRCDDLLDEVCREKGFVNSHARNLVRDIALEILRWRGRLDFFINNCPAVSELAKDNGNFMNYSRLVCYFRFLSTALSQTSRQEIISAIIDQAPEDISQPLKQMQQSIWDDDFYLEFPDPDKDPRAFISTYLSHPLWLVDLLIEEFGEEGTFKFCEHCNTPRSATVQINPRITTRRNVRRNLQELGYQANATHYSPYGLNLFDVEEIESLDCFQEGKIMAATEGEQLCAILGAMANSGCIIDTGKNSISRLLLLTSLLESGEVMVPNMADKFETDLKKSQEWFGQDVSISTPDFSKTEKDFRAEVVLVDAPCSELGQICLRPEIKWLLSLEDMKQLREQSLKKLDRWEPFVADKGLLVFVTTSVLRSENQQVVEDFLSRHPVFSLMSVRDCLPPSCHKMVDEAGYLNALPQFFDIEGTFAAVMVKGARDE